MKTGLTLGTVAALGLVLLSQAPARVKAAAPDVPDTVTYTKDVAPILQRSCENCHRVDGVAPMSLSTYEEVRPWARSIRQRTAIRDKAGAMPPWDVEKNIGIQQYKHDPSLSGRGRGGGGGGRGGAGGRGGGGGAAAPPPPPPADARRANAGAG